MASAVRAANQRFDTSRSASRRSSLVTAAWAAEPRPLTILHISGLPNRSSSAEAHVASVGPTERHALGCLRSDHSSRRTSQIHREDRRTEGPRGFCYSPRLRRASVGLKRGFGFAGGSANPNLGLACPPVLLSSCEILEPPRVARRRHVSFCKR